jgi:hypothetical protein
MSLNFSFLANEPNTPILLTPSKAKGLRYENNFLIHVNFESPFYKVNISYVP